METYDAGRAPECSAATAWLEQGHGSAVQANLLRLSGHQAVLEIYDPTQVFRLSQVLPKVSISIGGQRSCARRAFVRNIIQTSSAQVCEIEFDAPPGEVFDLLPGFRSDQPRKEFDDFRRQWEDGQRLLPEYKCVIVDLQRYMADLRDWLGQVENSMRAAGADPLGEAGQDLIHQLSPRVIGDIDAMIWKFEAIVDKLAVEERGRYRSFLRQQLHPLILCSPFAHRAFHKPLGYAGDYEMVNMIVQEPSQGNSLYARMINVWLLSQLPAKAHRNRIRWLQQALSRELLTAARHGHPIRVFNLACGPAVEVQAFIREGLFPVEAHFVLVDLNDETLAYTRGVLAELCARHGHPVAVEYAKKSVRQLLKDSVGGPADRPSAQYEVTYCSGLFDYFPGAVCARIMAVLYRSLAPGGLLIATNVDATLNDVRSFRYSLEFILDWYLIYRNPAQLRALAPPATDAGACRLTSDDTGVNCFLEIRKPADA